jgi:type II secretory pathway component PulK
MNRQDNGPCIVLAAAIHALIIVLGFALYKAQKYQFREAVKEVQQRVQQKPLTTR